MLTCTRYLIIVVQLLLLAEVPIPWAHAHNLLNDQDLQVHLQQYHVGQAAGQVPEGWHIHIALFGKASQAAIPAMHYCLPLEPSESWLGDARDLLRRIGVSNELPFVNVKARFTFDHLSQHCLFASCYQKLFGVFLL